MKLSSLRSITQSFSYVRNKDYRLLPGDRFDPSEVIQAIDRQETMSLYEAAQSRLKEDFKEDIARIQRKPPVFIREKFAIT